MASPYDYVQIVIDDDWGLVGIVPPGGAGERAKKMSMISPHNSQSQSQSPITNTNKLPKKVPEATMVNVAPRRKPVTRILTKTEPISSFPPQITPAEPLKSSENLDMNIDRSSRRSNPDLISGIFTDEPTNKQIFSYASSQFPDTFGNISSLAVMRNKDNILVGFGE